MERRQRRLVRCRQLVAQRVPGASDTATVNSGTVTVSADTTAGTLNLGGGAVSGTAVLTVSDLMNWTAGSMIGAGRTVIAEGATCNVGSAVNVGLDTRTFENARKVNWIGSAWLALWNGALITNCPSGVFEAQTDAYLARKNHRRVNRRSGERVQRVESIEPNENAPHRFFAYRL